MPLHLLGKKSWNVYNPENIAKVRRDEAAAQAQEQEEERRSRENEAEHRLRLLRGEEPLHTHQHVEKPEKLLVSSRPDGRKRRKLAGEDDTDRDIRLARDNAIDPRAKTSRRIESDLFDKHGHIDLIAEKASKDKQHAAPKHDEGQGMRFIDANGIKSGNSTPWYSGDRMSRHTQEVSKDVWGNEDPRRGDRDRQRLSASDPLLMMKRGVKQLRENDRQRKEWIAQRERDMTEVEELARRQQRRRRKRQTDEDSLDGFDLDDTNAKSERHNREQSKHRTHKHSHRHSRHEHRSRSPDRGKTHHRRHDRDE